MTSLGKASKLLSLNVSRETKDYLSRLQFEFLLNKIEKIERNKTNDG